MSSVETASLGKKMGDAALDGENADRSFADNLDGTSEGIGYLHLLDAEKSSKPNGIHVAKEDDASSIASTAKTATLTTAAAAAREKRNSITKSKGSGAASDGPNPHRPVKASRSNFTVPQPFSLTTEKRATLAVSAGPRQAKSPSSNGVSPPLKAQAHKKVPSPLQSKANVPSPSPAVTATGSPRADFVFKSDERAQKRMEFNATLSEKTKAREAERHQIQAKTQREIAAEIRKMRKDQTFRATPMPKFYQEPPPVKVDVKKTPPTRPKSPKLGRRSSNGGSGGATPKIIARRSSDEYEIGRESPVSSSRIGGSNGAQERVEAHRRATIPRMSKAAAASAAAAAATATATATAAAAMEEFELPLPPKVTLSERDSLPLDDEKDSPQMLEAEGCEQELETMMQLPVAVSLLDNDGEFELSGGDDDPELIDHDQHQFDHHTGHDNDDFDEEHSGGGGDGRVYISEEFRQAATEVHEFADVEDEEDEEGENEVEDEEEEEDENEEELEHDEDEDDDDDDDDDDDGGSTRAKVYVTTGAANSDGGDRS